MAAATKAAAKEVKDVKRVESVALDEIILDREIQQRVDWKANNPLIREYADLVRDGTKFPPVVVFEDPTSGETYMADGFNRYHAFKQAGKPKIPAEVKVGTKQDAIWYACGANKSHGLRRSNDDKKHAVNTALTHPNAARKSDREIAAHCGVSNTMVSEMRKKLEAKGEVKQRDTIETKGGRKVKNTKATKAKKSAAGKKGAASKPGVVSKSDKPIFAADAPVQDGEVLDGEGLPVTGKLKAVFRRVGLFHNIANSLTIIAKKYDELVKHDSGLFLGEFDGKVLSELADIVKAATPWRMNANYQNGWEPKDITKVARNKDLRDPAEI